MQLFETANHSQEITVAFWSYRPTKFTYCFDLLIIIFITKGLLYIKQILPVEVSDYLSHVECRIFWLPCLITHCSQETCKRVNGKQCKARSDAAECSIWSGSPLFANSLAIFLDIAWFGLSIPFICKQQQQTITCCLNFWDKLLFLRHKIPVSWPLVEIYFIWLIFCSGLFSFVCSFKVKLELLLLEIFLKSFSMNYELLILHSSLFIIPFIIAWF